jgi:hypothetical protein
MRHERFVFPVAVAALTLTFGACFLFAELSPLLSVTHDGAGYYLQVARNAADGRGFTFDSISPTNGFHPLWTGLLVAVFKAVSGSSESLFRLVGILNVALIGLAAVLLQRALRSLVSPSAATAGGVVFLIGAFNQFNLMESSLLLAVMSGLFVFAVAQGIERHYRPWSAFGFGVLLGATILARLDTAILAVVFGVVELVHIARNLDQRRDGIRRLALIVLGSSLLVLPYLAYNLVTFGAIMPISGLIERVPLRTSPSEIVSILRAMGKPILLPLLAGVAYLGWYVVRRPQPTTREARFLQAAAAILAVSCTVHAANEVFLVRWQLYWHFAPLVTLLALVMAIAWDGALRRLARPRLHWALLALLVGALGLFTIRSISRLTQPLGDRYRASYQTALWLREHTPAGARLAMESPEIIGFFSERSVVDLSGLCNDLAFQEAVSEQRLDDYLDRKEVDYLVRLYVPLASQSENDAAPAFYSDETQAGTIRIKSDLFEKSSEPLVVRRADEVYRSEPYREWNSDRDIVVAVWRREGRP